MELTILQKVITALAYGIALGVVTLPLSKRLILSRVEDPAEAAPLNTTVYKVLSVIIGIGVSFAVVFTATSIAILARNLLLLVPILSIALVDALIRKIPNPLLITMLVIQAIYLTYYCVVNKSAEGLAAAGIGLVIGFIACWAPSLLRIPMGNGDIKYNAVIGFCLAAVGYFQAMVCMGVLVFIYLIGLFIKTRDLKGSLEHLAAMGPFLSAGTLITFCTASALQIIGIVPAFL